MAKSKNALGVQNRHIYTRASYLYQAAHYLATTNTTTAPTIGEDGRQEAAKPSEGTKSSTQKLSRQLLSDMRQVSLKVLIRQSPQMKRTVCRSCDTLLIEGETCTSTIENASKDASKPWADVLSISCITCGNTKRYPVAARRQKRRTIREAEKLATDEKTIPTT